jgi:hypothetical protein
MVVCDREKNKNISKMEKGPSLPFHEWIFYTDQSVRDETVYCLQP